MKQSKTVELVQNSEKTTVNLFLAELTEFDDNPKSRFNDLLKGLSSEELAPVVTVVSNSTNYSDTAKAWLYKTASTHSIDLEQDAIEWVKEKLIYSDDWRCLLNILQSSDTIFDSPTFRIPAFQETLYNRYHFLLTHENKMINAWSYNGLIRLAYFNQEYREPVSQMMRLANEDGTGSIIARIRNSVKKYPFK